MGWNDLTMRLRTLFSRRRAERELDEELSFHLAMETEKNRARGVEPREAGRMARREFGGVEHFREECRDARGLSALENLVRDVRYGARVLGRTPVFTAVAMASLAIGIGANTAVFSLVDTVLLRSLPVQHAEELVVLGWSANNSLRINTTYSVSNGGGARGRWHTNVFSWPMFESTRRSGILAETIGFSQLPRLNVMTNGESRVTGGMAVTGNYFSGLGVRMALGRPLMADDDSEGGTTAAVISYRLWERAFGLDPAAVGRTMYINRKPYTVVGVTAREFYGISVTGLFLAPEIDVTLPIQLKEQIDGAPDRGNEWRSADLCWVQMMGRLKPGSGAGIGGSATLPSGAGESARSGSAGLARRGAKGRCGAGQSRPGIRAHAVQGPPESAGGSGEPRTVDGVRQPGGPVACPCGGAPAGDHDSAGGGRGTVAAGSSTAGGERIVIRGRRRGWAAAGALGLTGAARGGAGRAFCATGRHPSGSSSARLRGGRLHPDHCAFRPGAGIARHARGPGARPQGRRPPAHHQGTPGRCADTGGATNRGGAAAYGRRDAGGAEPGQPARDSAGIQRDPRGHLRAGRRPQRLRRSAQHGSLFAAAGRVEPHARRGGGQCVYRDSDERAQFQHDDFRGRREARLAEAQRGERTISGAAADSAGGGTGSRNTRQERGARRGDQRECGAPVFRRRTGDWPEFSI